MTQRVAGQEGSPVRRPASASQRIEAVMVDLGSMRLYGGNHHRELANGSHATAGLSLCVEGAEAALYPSLQTHDLQLCLWAQI